MGVNLFYSQFVGISKFKENNIIKTIFCPTVLNSNYIILFKIKNAVYQYIYIYLF